VRSNELWLEVVLADRGQRGQEVNEAMVDSPTPWVALSADELVGVLDRLTDGILVLGPEGYIQYASEQAGRLMARQPAELLGKYMRAEFPELVGHPFQLAVAAARDTGDAQRLVERYEPLDRWFEVRLFPYDERLVVLFRDTTEEQRSATELREYASGMSEAERIVAFGVWNWDVASGRVRWSDELHRIYGLEPGQFGGTLDAFMERVHPDDREAVWAKVSRSLETHEPFVFEERITREDGAQRILLSQGRVVVGADGEAAGLVGVCHDITDRARVEEALGASERRMHAIMNNTPSLITVKDLDGRYVMVNAESERITGMSADKLVGMHCEDVFPPEISHPQRIADVRAATEKEPIYQEAKLKRAGEERTYSTVTFALPGVDGVPKETCTIATDVTEQRERESARRRRIEWTDRIRSALSEGRILAFAQPILDVATGASTAQELLVRLRTAGDRSEILSPAAFLPAAEQYGLIQEIDVWMVRQALQHADALITDVNISAVTIGDPSARREIISLLEAFPHAAQQVVFEVTETANPVQLEAAQMFAEEATSHGCRFALDDFGVGFASLTYLRCLPLSFIKIDRSFVGRLASSAEDRRVVEMTIAIARQFELETIAEGIEDATTYELLRGLGAHYAQGYHLGRPAPV
jgi:PAS domain S-box-containing protein